MALLTTGALEAIGAALATGKPIRADNLVMAINAAGGLPAPGEPERLIGKGEMADALDARGLVNAITLGRVDAEGWAEMAAALHPETFTVQCFKDIHARLSDLPEKGHFMIGWCQGLHAYIQRFR